MTTGQKTQSLLNVHSKTGLRFNFFNNFRRFDNKIKMEILFSYHERSEYEPRGRGRSDIVSDRIGASPFDAIIDFARRHDGGNRTR